jgi:hypothetical protein
MIIKYNTDDTSGRSIELEIHATGKQASQVLLVTPYA